MVNAITILSLLYILYLCFEYRYLKYHRKKIKYVIHINGTRGKSTVCRLIDAGLRAGGYKVFTKTTGTSPRIIDVNRVEQEINRQGKANIREQIKAVHWAARQKADILIVECMAVKPELQRICEQRILTADITAITNVREDHLDEMGKSLDSIARSLSNTIPSNAVFFTADNDYFPFFEQLCNTKHTQAFLSDEMQEYYREVDFPENVALALAICRFLSVDTTQAFAAMKTYYKDPGSLKVLSYCNAKGSTLFFINTLAANDPVSTKIILNNCMTKSYWQHKKYLLINNRADRLSRMEQYVNFTAKHQQLFDIILISGENKQLFYKYLIRQRVERTKILMLTDDAYFDTVGSDAVIFAAGNICKSGKRLTDYFESKGTVIHDT